MTHAFLFPKLRTFNLHVCLLVCVCLWQEDGRYEGPTLAQAIELFGGRRWNMGTGGVEKSANQKNSPLSINDKTKKKKKVLVRVSVWHKYLFLHLSLSCSLVQKVKFQYHFVSDSFSVWPPTQGDSGDATDDEMVSRKTRSCKEGMYRNGPESDSVDQEDPGNIYRTTANQRGSFPVII